MGGGLGRGSVISGCPWMWYAVRPVSSTSASSVSTDITPSPNLYSTPWNEPLNGKSQYPYTTGQKREIHHKYVYHRTKKCTWDSALRFWWILVSTNISSLFSFSKGVKHKMYKVSDKNLCLRTILLRLNFFLNDQKWTALNCFPSIELLFMN